MRSTDLIQTEDKYGARIYHPLDIVIEKGDGCWLTDVEGKRYLDCLSAYSATNFGHGNAELIETAKEQLDYVTLTSRAFRNNQLPQFLEELCELTGYDQALPMNTGAEAVETALKAVRKWAYEVKGVADDQAEVIVMNNNFHGRTITIVGFSSEPAYKRHFGPYPAGFQLVDYGDIDQLAAAITPNTAAIMLEPIQGEAGVVVPPAGYLSAVAELCKQHNVLFVADEIQTGLGRTGQLLAVNHEDVKPDVLILGKSLGGGIYPVSAVLADKEILGLFKPGDHGSTFSGNPLGAAVARKVIGLLQADGLYENIAKQSKRILDAIHSWDFKAIKEIRGRGLFIGIELHSSARPYTEALAAHGMLCKETHENVIRIAPPLIIADDEVDFLLDALKTVFQDLDA